MTKVKDLHRDWMKDPKYQAEYEALDKEFQPAHDWLAVLKDCPVSMNDVPPRRRELGRRRKL